MPCRCDDYDIHPALQDNSKIEELQEKINTLENKIQQMQPPPPKEGLHVDLEIE